MRTGKEVMDSVKEIFKSYEETFKEGLADNELPRIHQRTVSRRKVEFLDKAIDQLQLSDEELKAWDVHQADLNSTKARNLFDGLIEELKANKKNQGDLRQAEFLLNNYRKIWTREEREAKVKTLGEVVGKDLALDEDDLVMVVPKAPKNRKEKRAKK